MATAFGRIGYVRTPLVLYRQHGGNTLGAKRWDLVSLFRVLAGGAFIRMCKDKRANLAATPEQAAAFARCYGGRLAPEMLRVVRAYAALPGQGFIARRATVLRYGILPDGVLKKIGVVMLI